MSRRAGKARAGHPNLITATAAITRLLGQSLQGTMGNAMGQCLGLRGATTADANTRAAIVGATEELLRELMAANHLAENDVAAVFFTTTPDLTAEFPAVAARVCLGWEQTALMSSHEIDVPGAPASVIRVMLLINTDRRKEDLVHVYLKGARNLRVRGTVKQ